MKPERRKEREEGSRTLESDSRAKKVSETAQEKITAINFTGRENGLIYQGERITEEMRMKAIDVARYMAS